MTEFTTPNGRTFTLGPLVWNEEPRFEGDTLWSKKHEIFDAAGGRAGTLFYSLMYSPKGTPARFHGSLSQLRWSVPGYASAPEATQGGFDTSPADTLDIATAAWARSADYILDWKTRT